MTEKEIKSIKNSFCILLQRKDKKDDFFINFIYKEIPHDQISEFLHIDEKEDCPTWVTILKEGYFNTFNHFSNLINKNLKNYSLFLSINQDTLKNTSWFPIENAHSIISNSFLQISENNFKYIIEKNMIIDFNSFIKNLDFFGYDYINQFRNKQHFRKNQTFRFDGLKYCLDFYYQKNNDITPLEKITSLLNDNNYLCLVDLKPLSEILQSPFYTSFITSYFIQDNINIPEQHHLKNLLYEIVEQKEFIKYKKQVFKLIHSQYPDIICLGIINEYFLKDDFISFIKNEELKNKLTKKFLDDNLFTTEKNQKIKL